MKINTWYHCSVTNWQQLEFSGTQFWRWGGEINSLFKSRFPEVSIFRYTPRLSGKQAKFWLQGEASQTAFLSTSSLFQTKLNSHKHFLASFSFLWLNNFPFSTLFQKVFISPSFWRLFFTVCSIIGIVDLFPCLFKNVIPLSSDLHSFSWELVCYFCSSA